MYPKLREGISYPESFPPFMRGSIYAISCLHTHNEYKIPGNINFSGKTYTSNLHRYFSL